MARGQSKSKDLHIAKRKDRPRVQIEYDVHVGDALEKKQLAFVVGVLGDFAGDSKDQLKDLAERPFIDINEENFDEVMARLKPSLKNMKVENTLAGNGTEMAVNLSFNSIDDFSPGSIVRQVEPLSKLMEIRNKLRDLQTNADNKAKLEKELEHILSNTEQVRKLGLEMGVSAAAEAGRTPAPDSDK